MADQHELREPKRDLVSENLGFLGERGVVAFSSRYGGKLIFRFNSDAVTLAAALFNGLETVSRSLFADGTRASDVEGTLFWCRKMAAERDKYEERPASRNLAIVYDARGRTISVETRNAFDDRRARIIPSKVYMGMLATYDLQSAAQEAELLAAQL